MYSKKTSLSDNEIRDAFESREKEAEELMEDAEKINTLLEKAKALLDKIEKLPMIGGLLDDAITTIELIGKYIKGDYRKIPARMIVSALGAMIYLVLPIDLIPDVMPVIGFADDAAVLTFVLGAGLSLELDKYRKWKEQPEIDELDRFVSEYEASIYVDEGDEEYM